MNFDIFASIPLNAILAGAAAVAAVEVGRAGARLYRTLQARKETEEKVFAAALESDNLKAVGAYLKEQLGSVDLATYARDAETRARVDRYIEKLARFLEVPSEGVSTEGVQPSGEVKAPTDFTALDAAQDDPDAMRLALRDFQEGEIWNALARLRRDIEMRLRGLLKDHREGRSLHQMVQLLGPRLPDDLRGSIEAFARIANQAIHGREIDPQEAMYAMALARKIYRMLRDVRAAGQTTF